MLSPQFGEKNQEERGSKKVSLRRDQNSPGAYASIPLNLLFYLLLFSCLIWIFVPFLFLDEVHIHFLIKI